MFRYCVWYVLKESHPIQQSVMKYADLFHSARFRAHITIGHSMDEEAAYMVLKRYRNFAKPCFTPIKKPFASSVNILNHNRSGECVFNAIEQPLAVNGVEVEDVHISMAYRVGEPFTPMEVAHVNKVSNINDRDIEVCMAKCFDENPEKWEMLEL